MPYILVTPASAEPVTLTEAKNHLRVDVTDDDALITALISAARQHAEMITQRQFLPATWKLVLDSFPGQGLTGIPAGVDFSLPRHGILLNKSPVQAVTSIKYLDMSGVQQTMPSTDYVVDISTEPARITPVFGKIWPINLPQIASVEITFNAGYQSVPEGIKAWIKIRIGSLYENRSEVDELTSGSLVKMPFVDGLLDPFRVVIY